MEYNRTSVIQIEKQQVSDIQFAISELILLINEKSSTGKLSKNIADKKISKLSNIIDNLSHSQICNVKRRYNK